MKINYSHSNVSFKSNPLWTKKQQFNLNLYQTDMSKSINNTLKFICENINKKTDENFKILC